MPVELGLLILDPATPRQSREARDFENGCAKATPGPAWPSKFQLLTSCPKVEQTKQSITELKSVELDAAQWRRGSPKAPLSAKPDDSEAPDIVATTGNRDVRNRCWILSSSASYAQGRQTREGASARRSRSRSSGAVVLSEAMVFAPLRELVGETQELQLDCSAIVLEGDGAGKLGGVASSTRARSHAVAKARV